MSEGSRKEIEVTIPLSALRISYFLLALDSQNEAFTRRIT